MAEAEAVTTLLQQMHQGDPEAEQKLFPIIYDELRRLARHYASRDRHQNTLQPTALVNEAYLRIFEQKHVDWKSKSHFFAVCAMMMRRVLVDYAREQAREKRADRAAAVTLNEELVGRSYANVDILALDEALKELGKLDPRQARIVELRFFTGLTQEETADILEISSRTVKREWRMAKAWLFNRLKSRQDSFGA